MNTGLETRATAELIHQTGPKGDRAARRHEPRVCCGCSCRGVLSAHRRHSSRSVLPVGADRRLLRHRSTRFMLRLLLPALVRRRHCVAVGDRKFAALGLVSASGEAAFCAIG